MRASLTINSFELGDYIVEDGIKITTDARVSKSIITANGEKWYSSLDKIVIDVELSDMFDDVYADVAAYFSPSPASVTYSNFDTGVTYSGTFYVEKPDVTVGKSISDITYLRDLKLKLVEK